MSRKFRLWFRRQSPQNALALLVTALKIVKATSDAVSTVPLLGVIAGAVLDLTETLEKMHGSKEKCVQLARRAADLLEHIKKHIECSPSPTALNDSLSRLVGTLMSIRIKVEKEFQRSWFYRFGHQSSVASTLDDCIQELEDAWHTFDTACLVLLHKEVEVLKDKMDSQAKYDGSSQVRIIRICDVNIMERNGTCRVLEKYEADEYRAEYKGRRVVLRQLRQSAKKGEMDFSSIIVYNPNLHGVHLNLMQVLGRSHPSVQKPFYVMECGNVPLMHDYDVAARGVTLVRSWLGNILDYWSAHSFAREVGIPVVDPLKAVWHGHGRNECLPSASLNHHGRLLLDAGDLRHSNTGCIDTCIDRLFSQAKGLSIIPLTSRGLHIGKDAMNAAEHLLSSLNGSNATSVSCAMHVSAFIGSVVGQMWSMNHLRQSCSAELGEYGYIHRDADGERFVRLGHIDELPNMPPISTYALHRKEAPSGSSLWEKVYDWPGEIFSADFKINAQAIAVEKYTETSVLIHDIAPENSRSFFWDNAEDIALRHGIPLHELILVVEIRRTAQVTVSDMKKLRSDDPSSSRSTVSFHYLPAVGSGQGSDVWGYWSLESIPAASTPNDEPVIEGISFAQKKTACYYYSSPLQAEVVRTLNSLRRPDPASGDERRFDTIS